ncbi:MAG: cytochrome c family protein [Deltaproteobacteria bacterium]|nr:cytochrome c family protein [Deltaproteobacteria bacterium]
MAQIFPKWANKLPAYSVGGIAVAAMIAPLFVWYYFSPEYTDVGYQPHQPVPYSHKLHVGELGLDCRYCHVGVEVAAVASVPPTQVCMNCHQLVLRDSEKLAPIRKSAETGDPMRWVRVHKVPEYAFFDHSVHISAGVGCSSCHGDIGDMEEVRQVEPLSMGWCLQCHRDPDPHLRPPEQIFNTRWVAPENQLALAAEIRQSREIAPPEDCSACHR